MAKVFRVGLTGNIGSGKTTTGLIFEKLGIPVYRADEKGKYFLDTQPVSLRIKEEFGPIVTKSDGGIDRKKLAAVVFNDLQKLEKLNGIIHPLVREDFAKWVNNQESAPYVIQEAAILFETGQHELFDSIIMVTAPKEVRVDRVCRRDGASPEEVSQREKHQMEEAGKAALADFVIINDGKRAILPQVLEIHGRLSGTSGGK